MSDRTIGMIQDALECTGEILSAQHDVDMWPPSHVMAFVLDTLAGQLTPEDDREDAAEDAG